MSHRIYRKPIIGDGETPRPDSDFFSATGKERRDGAAGTRHYEATILNPQVGEQRINLSYKSQMKLGTWNVRSMLTGKLEVVKAEMKRLDLAVLGLSETRWQGQGHFNSGEVRVVISEIRERLYRPTPICRRSWTGFQKETLW